MAARSKRFAGLDMASLNAEKAKEMKDQPLPIPDLQHKAMEATGTGVLHWENMQLHRLPMAKELIIPGMIHTLKIYNNSLHEFPSEVMSLRRLESLEVNANMLTSIPADITRLETLRSLHLHHNHIQKLPPEVGGLTNLTSLRVHGNRLKELPLETSYCTNLTELSVQDNPMHKPFVDCHEVPLHDLMTALGHLRLCQERKELHLVPMCVGWLKASAIEQAHRLSSVLTSLYAPHNDMAELTDLIGDFTRLGVLTLFSCGIAKVSPRVCEIKVATHIDLRSNNLSILPPVLDLPKLTTLLLDDNKFEEFPNCVLTCPALEYLSLRNNQIDTVPIELGVLTSLTILSLANNKLVDMPVEVGKLSKLKVLEVVGNMVSNIPMELLGDAEKAEVAMPAIDVETCKEPRMSGDLHGPEVLGGVEELARNVDVWGVDTQVMVAYFQRLDYGQTHMKMDMGGLGLHGVQIAMMGLTHLTELNLSDNLISQLPLGMAFMNNIKQLHLHGNDRIEWMPNDVLSNQKDVVIEMLARVRAGNDSERLDLSRLQLTLCPGCVYEIESLITLDLRFNDIYKLPDDFGFVRTFATLELLLLEHNRLRSIPDSFGDMTSLTELRLSHNDLRFVAPELSECTLITQLALDNNPALESPPIHVVDKGLEFTMSYLAELNKGRTSKTFNLNGRGYLRVPVDLTRYDHLIRLDLSDNHLTNVPNNICGVLTNLEALYCARNRLTGLPDGIGLLFKLLVLDASDNKIGLVPASFTKLRLLHTCSFSNNKLTWVPNTVGHMASMRELSLQGNELRSPPAEIVAQGTMRILRFLRGLAGSEHSRILNLSALGLAALPLIICRQTNLTELKLFQNKIEEVPAKAGRMVKLTHLVLSANRISELPGVLTRWQLMQRLYVDDNLLTSIPSSIGQLTHLSELRVAGNRLVELPETIGQLEGLMLLDASRNEIESLPRGLTLMTRLIKLRLNNNKVVKLVDGLDSLVSLEELSVGHNPLLCLPPELCLLRQIKLLQMDECPELASPPLEIREQGLMEVMNYLERVQSAKLTRVLDLAWLGVKNMYLDPDSLTSLTTLNLSGNDFEDLPRQIPLLVGLKTLTFDENRLRLLPPGLGCLTNITKLSFKGNPVESPPEEIIDRGTDAILSFLRKLWIADQTQELDLSGQGIESIHVSVCELTPLLTLCLDDNRCTTLPNEIFQLQSLTHLSLRNNRLVKLPPTIGMMSSVSTLLIDNNPDLKSLPPEACNLTNLTTLGFSGNSLRSPGMELCNKGVKAVLAYLACLLKAVTSKHLIVSSQGMSEFAVDLAARPTVTAINVANNYLDGLHHAFFILLNMTHLDISYNRIKSIPGQIGNLRELVWFNADGNILASLPSSLAYIQGIEYISACENSIGEIPEEFRELTTLHTLSLSSNRISTLRGDLSDASSLTILNISNNNVVQLPVEWGFLTNLETLDLGGNSVEDPPLEVRRIGVKHVLRYLQQVHESFSTNKLFLSDLNLENVEGVIRRNFNLTEAHFDRNKIKHLSPLIGKCERLQVLSIIDNDMNYLPSELGQCTTLKELRVDSAKLISPPQDILSEDIQYVLRYLRNFAAAKLSGKLDLTGSLHRELPPEILGMTSLTWLSLRENIITELPAAVTSLINLTHLDMAGNKFVEVPAEIGNMTRLKHLALEDNEVQVLPRTLRFLTALEVLTIKNKNMWSPPPELHMQGPGQILRFINSMVDGIMTNRLICEDFHLEEIPLEVLKETQLQFLSLARNKIRAMPISFGEMGGLEELYLNDNQLAMITPVIWQITGLTKLSFANNNLRNLPPEMGLMDPERVVLLDVSGCPELESPPPEVVTRGIRFIIPYLEALFNSRMSMHIGLKRWLLEHFSFDHLDNLKEVTSVDLSWNKYTEIPNAICSSFPALKSLQLDRNELKYMMPDVGLLTSLTILHSTWNVLVEIPASICALGNLKDLRLHHNEIVKIPENIGDLTSLINLDMNTNFILELPESLTNLWSLETVDFHDNQISELPDNCSRLTSLVHLNVAENRLTIIQDEIGMCPFLETIESAHNPLVMPPEEVSIVGGAKVSEYIRNLGRSHLTNMLSLPSMNLSHIPDRVLSFTNLVCLEMFDNQIPVLPLELFTMTSLTVLSFNANRLGDLQPEIAMLWQLEELSLDRNDLMDLPYDIHRLTNLKVLSIADNLVSVLPLSIAWMTQLEELNCFGNESHMPPREIMKMGLHAIQEYLARQLGATKELPKNYSVGEKRIRNTEGIIKLNNMEIIDLDKTLSSLGEVLIELYCNYNLMSDLPKDITTLSELKVLEVGHNQFKQIPQDVCELGTLKRLDMRNNLLTSIPSRIGELHEIKELILNNNTIGTVPPEIRSLNMLKVLDLNSNILEVLPHEVGNINGLYELRLGNNRLSAVPASIKNMRGLQILDVSSNNLVTLPPDWCGCLNKLSYLDMARNKMVDLPAFVVTCQNLTHLDFRDNHITEVPLDLDNLMHLKTLHLTGNSLTNPPAEILRLGFTHTMKYMKQLNKGFKTKNMILGHLTLEKVPQCVVAMTALTELSFKDNLLSTLTYQGTDDLALMDEEALESLYVIGAPVQALGMTLSPLVNLHRLSVANNLLTMIPVDILLLTNLASLDLSNNKLTILYLEFVYLPKLTELVVLNNDWRSPHASVVELPFDMLMQYLKEVHQAHETGSLVMNGRHMQAVTADITLATALTSLNLDNNSIPVLTPDFADLFYLQYLSLRKNKIVTLPWEFGGLASLSHMDLGNNHIEDMPGVVGTLSSLKVLMLDHNGLAKLPNAIGELVKLERLAVEQNDLTVLPPTMVNLTSLTFLDASHNNLRILPYKIGELASLQELHANNNQLYSLPQSIGMCTSLHTLALSNNFISVVPLSIQYLSSLTHLSVKNNAIKVLPPAMSQNELLVNFDFANNPILDPPKLVLEKGFDAVMLYLKKMFDVTFTGHLDLRDLQLPDLPADLLGAMGGPGDESSSSAATEARPPSARKGTGPAVKLGVPIRELSLTGNRLEYLPPFVGELSALRDIHIDDTIKEPPPHILGEGLQVIQLYLRKLGTSRRTSFLDLSGMMLDTVELSYYKLDDLINAVNLGHNKLSSIPDEIFKYRSLTWLDLRNNRIEEIPEAIGNLTEIRHMDMRNNQISVAPLHIFQHDSLLYMSLQNNPVTRLGGSSEGADARMILAQLQADTLNAEEDGTDDYPELPTEEEFQELDHAAQQEEPLEVGSLQHLLFKDCSLISIPQIIGTALTQLDLGRNRLMEGCIEQLIALQRLRILRLPGNRLRSIPEDIEDLTSLVILDLSSNHLTVIPPEVSKLTKLCFLSLRFNDISVLPGALFKLTQIQQLQLSSNRIEAIPVFVGDLLGLRELLVDNNQIMSLPLELGKLTRLEELNVEGNPGNLLPEGFAEKGMKAVMEFFAWNCYYPL